MTLARAKNTDRAEARRRFREARAAEVATSRRAAGLEDEDEELIDPVTGRAVVRDEPEEVAPKRAGRSGFRMPDVRRDLADLPQLFRDKRLLYIPFALLLIAFLAGLALTQDVITDPQLTQVIATFVQFTLPPSSLLLFFLGGFIAPRSSYLIGLLLGIFDGVLYELLLISTPGVRIVGEGTPVDTTVIQLTATSITVGIVYAIIIGTVGAAFAAWYRNFLRSSQDRARQSRLERDAKLKATQKAEARAAKRPAKPASR
jgi:hypothetical protein